MAAHGPIAPRIRRTIARWPVDAPRGAVSTSCAEHGIRGETFHELRERVRLHGPAAVLEPRSRRPVSRPARLTEDVEDQAVAVRASLETSGLDHGPISVHDERTSMGLPVVPSTAFLARLPCERGVARAAYDAARLSRDPDHLAEIRAVQADLHGGEEADRAEG